VNVGDATGTLFTWESNNFSMKETRMKGASLSKWPAAVMISGLVEDGTMAYDDPVNKYLSWWSKNETDPRSRVTLRHLLSFTSGYTKDQAPLLCEESFQECTQKQYEKSTHYVEPGTTWTYLGCHL